MEFSVIKSNLEKLGYIVKQFETKEEAAKSIAEDVVGKTVGIGGSVTVQQMGLYELLSRNNTVSWHWMPKEGESPSAVRATAASAQVYISSVNGIAETGEIVNIDATGNRVSATMYGHERVILVVGKNKIAPNCESALDRAKNIAAPKNAMRLNCKLPCAIKGDRCYNCNSPQKICRVLSIFNTKPGNGEYEVVLINEDLGY